MGAKWTTQQQEAIDARGSDILVSAAAGSGKTAVLVERIIQRITAEEDQMCIRDSLWTSERIAETGRGDCSLQR